MECNVWSTFETCIMTAVSTPAAYWADPGPWREAAGLWLLGCALAGVGWLALLGERRR